MLVDRELSNLRRLGFLHEISVRSRRDRKFAQMESCGFYSVIRLVGHNVRRYTETHMWAIRYPNKPKLKIQSGSITRLIKDTTKRTLCVYRERTLLDACELIVNRFPIVTKRSLLVTYSTQSAVSYYSFIRVCAQYSSHSMKNIIRWSSGAQQAIARRRNRAESGDSEAQCILGLCYETIASVQPNVVHQLDARANAILWYQRSVNGAYAPARYCLDRLTRQHDVDPRITNDEIGCHPSIPINVVGDTHKGFLHDTAMDIDDETELYNGVDYGNDGSGHAPFRISDSNATASSAASAISYFDGATSASAEHELGNLNANDTVSKVCATPTRALFHTVGVAELFDDMASSVCQYAHEARKGVAEAQFVLSLCFLHGIGVAFNVDRAVLWIRRAAFQGYAPSEAALGRCYLVGEGLPQNYVNATQWLRRAVKQRNANAQFLLAFCYETAIGAPYSREEALRWYTESAEQGHVGAQYRLGCLHDAGRPPYHDLNAAIQWYRRAAAQGDTFAQFNLALCYDFIQTAHERTHTQQAASEAVEWYRHAADKGFAPAQHNLAVCYIDGTGMPQDARMAVYWFQRAANQSYPPSQYSLGVSYDTGQGIERCAHMAAFWYRRAAEHGHARAQYNLGLCIDAGYDGATLHPALDAEAASEPHLKFPASRPECRAMVSSESLSSATWYRRAAEQGHADAQHNWAICLVYGYGVPVNIQEALYWFRIAAQQNKHAGAQFALGVLCASDRGSARNVVEAAHWYRQAAEQGHVEAQYRIGCCYQHGTGVSPHNGLAKRWYRRAARQGHPHAQFHLAKMYLDGVLSRPPNVTKALVWLRRAAAQHHAAAETLMERVACAEGGGSNVPKTSDEPWIDKATDPPFLDQDQKRPMLA